MQFDTTNSSNPIIDAKGVIAEGFGFTPKKGTQTSYDEWGNATVGDRNVGYASNLFYTGLENWPGAMPTMAYSAKRGANTILKGNTKNTGRSRIWNEKIRHTEDYSAFSRNGWGRQFRPRQWGRFSSQDIFLPEQEGVKGWRNRQKTYSPFQGADFINKRMSTIATRAAGDGFGSESAKSAANWLEKKKLLERGEDGVAKTAMQRGTMSHISASMKVARQPTITQRQASSMNSMLTKLGKAEQATMVQGMSGRQAGLHYLANVSSGTISSRFSGYMAGANFGEDAVKAGTNRVFQAGAKSAVDDLALGGLKREGGKLLTMSGEKATARVAVSAGKTVFKKSLETGGKKMAAKTLARYGASLGASLATGPAAPVVALAMTAWMIYDMTKLGVSLVKEGIVKPAVETAKAGFKSFKGQIDKSPFGTGFKDNSVLMTSRQRGVAAISNSRLNARSVLGNEASAMYQHFG